MAFHAAGPLDFGDLLVRMRRAQRIRDLWFDALRYLRGCGVREISYHYDRLAPTRPEASPNFDIAAEGFPEDWVARYVEQQLWTADPILRSVQTTGRAQLWSEVQRQPLLQPAEIRFVQALRESPLGDGLAIPLAGMGLRHGYAGFGFGYGAAPPGAGGLAELQAAAQMAHLAHGGLLAQRAAERRELSPREIEVLTWIVRGKSNGVIAEILGVSRHTVDTLVRRLFDKLGVVDRTSAALRAVARNLIPPYGLAAA
jgi:LuxR family transcriptional regulator/LuxR family quorum-sensing system transcriptional regulator CciR